MNFVYPPGATPIDANDEADLILTHITTQSQLNEAEYQNILESRLWSRRRKHRDLLSIAFVERLHQRMFGDVWKWAAEPRKVELQNKAFVPPHLVAIDLKSLLDNTQYRLDQAKPETPDAWDRLAAEFHHRLVRIHYFRNGNGRHAREMTDLLLLQYDQQPFSWGGATEQVSLTQQSETRERYIAALRAADAGDYAKLLAFVRS